MIAIAVYAAILTCPFLALLALVHAVSVLHSEQRKFWIGSLDTPSLPVVFLSTQDLQQRYFEWQSPPHTTAGQSLQMIRLQLPIQMVWCRWFCSNVIGSRRQLQHIQTWDRINWLRWRLQVANSSNPSSWRIHTHAGRWLGLEVPRNWVMSTHQLPSIMASAVQSWEDVWRGGWHDWLSHSLSNALTILHENLSS